MQLDKERVLESERIVLGTLINNNLLTVKALEKLKEDDFYRTSHRLIFNAIYKLFKSNIKFDVQVIINSLIKEIKANATTVTEITDIAAQWENVTIETHINIISDSSKNRKIIKLCNEVALCEDDPDAKAKKIQNELLEIMINSNNDKYISMNEALERTLDKIDKAYKSKTGITGIETGIDSIDTVLNGLERGAMNVFAARPSMGKTAFSLELIKNLKGNVLYVEQDMTIEGLSQRLIASVMNIENGKIGRGKLTDSEYVELAKTISYLSKKDNIFFITLKRPTLTNILLTAKEIKIKKGLDVIIIDHIGKIIPETKGSKYEQMTFISNELKRLAIELDLNMVVLCQLNRGCEQRQDKRPMLSDLRDTGAIEEDADNIGLLYRDGYYKAREDGVTLDTDILEINFAKVRNGRVGKIEFEYDLPTQRLTQMFS